MRSWLELVIVHLVKGCSWPREDKELFASVLHLGPEEMDICWRHAGLIWGPDTEGIASL